MSRIAPYQFIYAALDFNATHEFWKAAIEPNATDLNYVGVLIHSTPLECKPYITCLLVHVHTIEAEIKMLLEATLLVLIGRKEEEERVEHIYAEAREEGIPNEYGCTMS